MEIDSRGSLAQRSSLDHSVSHQLNLTIPFNCFRPYSSLSYQPPAVVRSLEEAGNQLLTFYEFPRAMWKSIRTTNALENLNREFRRRTKTQASFSSEESAVALLFGLIASGQIQLRRVDGYQGLSEVLEHAEVAA